VIRSRRRDPDPPVARPPVLLLTRDRALADHVAALAEAAGAALLVRAAVPGRAGEAPLTLIGQDVAADLPAGHRGGVLVVRAEGADPPEGVWRQAVQIGADRVAVLPEAEPWLLEELADAARTGPASRIVAVLPGSGGAGASTLAVALAVTAAHRGARSVLLDVDPLGGGLDLALGLDRVPGLRWPDVPSGPGRWPPGLVTTALPEIGGVRVLACSRDEPVPLRPDRVGAAVDAAARESDLVVVDLPRQVTATEVEVLSRSSVALVVVAAEVRAAAAAAQLSAAAGLLGPELRVVVRPRAPGGLDPAAVADALELPLAVRLVGDPAAAALMDRGEAAALAGRGPLAQVCRELLAEVEPPW